MPLEDLLAFYGYEPTIPVMTGSNADSSPSELADELPDMTLDKVSQNCFALCYGLKIEICVTLNYISPFLDVTKYVSLFISICSVTLNLFFFKDSEDLILIIVITLKIHSSFSDTILLQMKNE